MTIIGLKELRQNATAIVARAQKGERFIVVKRSKPVLTVGPPPQSDTDLDQWLEQYISDNRELLVALKDK